MTSREFHQRGGKARTEQPCVKCNMTAESDQSLQESGRNPECSGSSVAEENPSGSEPDQ